MILSSTAPTTTAFSSLASIYRTLPPGETRDQRISETLENTEIEGVVNQILKDYSESIKSVPMLKDLKIKVAQKQTPPREEEISPNPLSGLIKIGGTLVKKFIRSMDSSMTLEDVEAHLLRGNFKALESLFFDYPYKIEESFNLIHFHLKMGIVKFEEILPILSKAAESIISIDEFDDFAGGEPMPVGQGPYPSILNQFYLSFKDHIQNKQETLDISPIRYLISQDLHSLESYEHKAKSLELLRMLPLDLLKKILQDKNNDDSTLLHDPDVFNELLPLCLERFSLDELILLFFYKNNLLTIPLDGLKNDSKLLQSQKTLLAAVIAKGINSGKISAAHQIHGTLSQDVKTFLNIFTNPLKTVVDFKNAVVNFSAEDKCKAIALFIETRQLPLKNVPQDFFDSSDLKNIFNHLNHLDLRGLSSEEAISFLTKCTKIHTLIINDVAQGTILPPLPDCRYLDVSKSSSIILPELPKCEQLHFNQDTVLPSLMRTNIILKGTNVAVLPLNENNCTKEPKNTILDIAENLSPQAKILLRPTSNSEKYFDIHTFTQNAITMLGGSLFKTEDSTSDFLLLKDGAPLFKEHSYEAPYFEALGELMAYCEKNQIAFQLPLSNASLESIRKYDPKNEEQWYLETYIHLTNHEHMATTSIALNEGDTPDWHMVSPSETKTPPAKEPLQQKMNETAKQDARVKTLHSIASARAKFLEGK